jgi:hypothetical protein
MLKFALVCDALENNFLLGRCTPTSKAAGASRVKFADTHAIAVFEVALRGVDIWRPQKTREMC